MLLVAQRERQLGAVWGGDRVAGRAATVGQAVRPAAGERRDPNVVVGDEQQGVAVHRRVPQVRPGRLVGRRGGRWWGLERCGAGGGDHRAASVGG